MAAPRKSVHPFISIQRCGRVPKPTDTRDDLANHPLLRVYLTVLARSHMRLDDAMVPHLAKGYENRFDIVFRQKCSAFYYALRELRGSSKPTRVNITASFPLRIDELWPGGPGFISAFGMDAIATLAWCCQLQRRLPDLLREPNFTEIELGAAPAPLRPTNLRWTLDCQIDPPILAYRP